MVWQNPEFADRREAGRELGEALAARDLPQPLLVLALPRGGVAVAAEVARRLSAPLDVLIVRKIPAPGEPELALGAVAEGEPPVVVFNPDVAALTNPSRDYVETSLNQQLLEIGRRQGVYRGEETAFEVRGRNVILVDDGLATGATARAAAQALRKRGAGASDLGRAGGPPIGLGCAVRRIRGDRLPAHPAVVRRRRRLLSGVSSTVRRGSDGPARCGQGSGTRRSGLRCGGFGVDQSLARRFLFLGWQLFDLLR
jgi:putative phosphoribosyl transferase